MFERCHSGSLVRFLGLICALALTPSFAAENGDPVENISSPTMDASSDVVPAQMTETVAAEPIAAESEPSPAIGESNSAFELIVEQPAPNFQATVEADETPPAESEFQWAKIADAYIDLHSGPGRGFPVYQAIERGEWVEIMRRRTEWMQLRTRRGIVGWASISSMKETLTASGDKFTVAEVTEEQFRQRTFEVGFQFGEFESVNSLTTYGAWSFTENLAVELAYQETLGSISDGQLLNLSLTNTPFPEWRFSPFFALGAGIIRTEPFGALVQTEDRQDNTAHVGAGLRTYITRSFVFRMDYKHYVVLTSRNENENVEEWKLGFSVFF